ncbi:RNA polymerase III subunit RPC82-domain-containing protein [Whalleya microplaca]|nr:RNA polymerase III subunit RPC82-domain-containing protein [Whalleya microplaca]
MLVTKNAAELCVLLVTELYGQLPSRLFADLVAKGRLTVAQLAQNTSLNQKQVRHGIAVLIQLNLIFHHTDQDSTISYYEANPNAAYNLVRTGKILDMVRTKYGQHANTLVHDVLILGHIRISDLIEAYRDRHREQQETVNGESSHSHSHMNGNGNSNGNGINGANGANGFTSEDEESDPTEQAYESLAQLIAVGILETVSSTMFQSSQDQRSAVEQEVMKDYPNGVRGTKQTNEFDKQVREELRKIQTEQTRLKRRLEYEFMYELGSKRRKLTNGAMSNAFSGPKARSVLLDETDTVVRLNYDKCLVELRNQRLVRYAEDFIGEITAEVYASLLAALSKKVTRCQLDRSTQIEGEDDDSASGPSVTTQEIFEHLSPSVNVLAGIGKPEDCPIDLRYAERIRRYPPQLKNSTLQATLEEGDEVVGSDDEDYDHSGEAILSLGANGDTAETSTARNGSRNTKVKFDDGVPVGTHRLHQMRQHLLILAQSKQGFVRHCGGRDFGEWTVDFEPLMQHLKFVELDTMIEESFGRQGLRLTRILREKGKIDDKTLPNIALMRKPDVHVKMAEMEMAGFLDVQEVPRDNNRAAARTIFFWFFDQQRTIQRTLDNTYKAMVRCMQRLDVERRKKMNVLQVVERKDVRGMEEEKLRGDIYNEYVAFLDVEKKLLGQVAKLDDVVAVFRDF